MKHAPFRSLTTAGILSIAASLHPLVRAAPIELLSGTSVGIYDDEGATALDGGTELADALQFDFSASGTSYQGDWTLDGRVTSRVFSNVTANNQGGLSFVYEVENLSGPQAPEFTPGILNFLVPGWGGAATWVAKSSSVQSSLPTLANPGDVARYNDGSQEYLDFSYPPGGGEPPIFAQQVGWQLIVHTNISLYSTVWGGVRTSDFDFSNFDGQTYDGIPPIGDSTWVPVQIYGVAASVPDSGTTVSLALLGLAILVTVRRRSM